MTFSKEIPLEPKAEALIVLNVDKPSVIHIKYQEQRIATIFMYASERQKLL
jgi:hypothetical protein